MVQIVKSSQCCLKKFPLWWSQGYSDLPEGRSKYLKDHPWGNFSRQPLRTFHCLSDFSRGATNWTSSRACDEFVSTCVPPAVLPMRRPVHVRPAVLRMHSAARRGKKLHYYGSEQILQRNSGETSRLLAQTLTVLNLDLVWSILKSVQI